MAYGHVVYAREIQAARSFFALLKFNKLFTSVKCMNMWCVDFVLR